MTQIHRFEPDDCSHDTWEPGCPVCDRQREVNRERAARLEHRPFSWPDRPGFYDDPAKPSRAADDQP